MGLRRWLLFTVVGPLLTLVPLSSADLLDTILNALENAVDCDSCQALLLPLQTLAYQGNEPFSTTLTKVCQTLKLQDDDVCAGTFNLRGPILAHSLRQFTVGGTTSIKFCTSIFGLCTQPLTPFTVNFPKSPPDRPRKFVSRGREPFQVVHFSDVHIDRQYTIGAEANCTKNICCRNFASQTGPTQEPAQPFGNPKCDSPSNLAESLLNAILEIVPNARFSIFTGDVIEGATWLVNKSEGLVDLSAWNSQMASRVRSPVYGAIGNHDTAPVDSFPRDNTVTSMDSQWVFDTQSRGWEMWINATAAQELKHTSGSYAVVVPHTNLRLISVNTQYWYPQNYWLYDTDHMPTDPNGILAFMVSQLQAAEDAGQRAWIFGHIPSGKADIFHDQSNYYDQIVQRYKNTIAAQFFGHSHKDQFEIAYSDYNNQTAETADSVLFICPALTPTSGNPAFKVYDIDPDTFEVMDSKVFTTNVSDPSFHVEPKWELYYSARESYGSFVGGLQATDSLNASFWHKVTEVFEADDSVFQLYNTRISRGGAVSPCTGDCKTVTICDQRAARSQNNCDVPISHFLTKRDEPTHIPQDECEGNAIRSIFMNLLSKKSEHFSEGSRARIRRSIFEDNIPI